MSGGGHRSPKGCGGGRSSPSASLELSSPPPATRFVCEEGRPCEACIRYGTQKVKEKGAMAKATADASVESDGSHDGSDASRDGSDASSGSGEGGRSGGSSSTRDSKKSSSERKTSSSTGAQAKTNSSTSGGSAVRPLCIIITSILRSIE
jgi:hypothetical protein